jgi:hypothetical protein
VLEAELKTRVKEAEQAAREEQIRAVELMERWVSQRGSVGEGLMEHIQGFDIKVHTLYMNACAWRSWRGR